MPTVISDQVGPSELADAVNIELDATDDSNLNFLIVKPKIDEAIAAGKKLFFEFQFGLDSTRHNFKDQMQFFGLSIAIASFAETIYEPYKDHIKGVILYRGRGDFSEAILGHLELKQLFHDFSEGVEGDSKHLLHLFSLQVLMEYLHRIGAALPEELSMHILLNLKGVTRPSYQAQLLSADLFPYIKPAVKGVKIPYFGLAWEKGSSQVGYIGRDFEEYQEIDDPNIALLLPELGSVPHKLFDAEVESLSESNVNYKIIPEDSLNESWYLIDDLIVFEGCISGEGKRMIDGFIAAGGRVKKIGAPFEDALSE